VYVLVVSLDVFGVEKAPVTAVVKATPAEDMCCL
jgi:hypothetical protein